MIVLLHSVDWGSERFG